MPASFADRLRSHFGTAAVGGVFLLGLCLAATGRLWWQNEIYLDAEAQFKRSVERVVVDVAQRFIQPRNGLNGARGLYAASNRVPRAAFKAYVDSREMPVEFTGVRGFGFIQHVMRQDVDAFVAAEQADGAPRFAIRQLADKNHDDLYVIKFIEPAAHNGGAQGLDVGSEALRRAGAQQAIDTGNPTISGAITLVQDDRKTPGVLLYVPVYANGTHPTSTEARRAALVGLLYAPIVIAELLDGLADVGPDRLDFELFDSAAGSPLGKPIYDADKYVASTAGGQEEMTGRRFSTTEALVVYGREMTLRLSSTPGFDAAIDRRSPWIVFAGITLLSALLALLLRQQATGRRRAEVLAQRMTEQLRQDQERSADFSRSASDWFWETDAQHHFCYFSDNFETVYGLEQRVLLGKSRKEFLDQDELNPPATIEAHRAQLEAHLPFKNFEYQTRNRTGEIIWVMVSGLPHIDADGDFAGYRGTGTLITERKRIEEEIRQQNDTLSTLFENFPGGISMFNADLLLTEHNHQFKQLLNFPDSLFKKPGVCFEDIIRYNAERGEYGLGDVEQQVAAIVARAREFQPHKAERARPDGTILEIRGVPMPGGGFVSIYTDITERRTAEMALANQTRRLADILVGTHVGTWEWNVQTGETVFNERWAEIIGYRLDELAPISIETWMKFAHPDDLKLSGDLLEKHFAGELDYYECESRMRHKDGRWLWVLDRGKVSSWTEGGKPLLMSGTHQDITARIRILRHARTSRYNCWKPLNSLRRPMSPRAGFWRA
jgi:PAS domain S-box-containing protein